MAKGTLVKIEPNGTLNPVRIENPKGWTVEELYRLIGNGCDIVEGLRVNYEEKPRIAYVDENARIAIRGRPIPPVNAKATEMYRAYYGPSAKEILGVAVVWIPDPAEGRKVLSTRKKPKRKAEREMGPTHEEEEVIDAKEKLQEGTPRTLGGVTPMAPGSDD
jgi:hypothetical protein